MESTFGEAQLFRRAAGFFLAMVRRRSAVLCGRREPCSQLCTALGLTQRKKRQRVPWLKPFFWRWILPRRLKAPLPRLKLGGFHVCGLKRRASTFVRRGARGGGRQARGLVRRSMLRHYKLGGAELARPALTVGLTCDAPPALRFGERRGRSDIAVG